MTTVDFFQSMPIRNAFVLFGGATAAVGVESEAVLRAYEQFADEYFVPISRESIPSNRFYRLKEKWEEETGFLSSVSDIAMHPAYQQIIGMGLTAIPFILREMAIKPGQWFWALKSITNEDPVKPGHRGIVAEMTRDWLLWGRQWGYIH